MTRRCASKYDPRGTRKEGGSTNLTTTISWAKYFNFRIPTNQQSIRNRVRPVPGPGLCNKY